MISKLTNEKYFALVVSQAFLEPEMWRVLDIFGFVQKQ